MGHYFEIWTRPGDPNFGTVVDDPPFREATIHDAVNLKGDGSMQIPNSFDRFDEVLKVDGANSASSLVRVRSDIDGSVVFEWIPRALVPTSSKSDPYEELTGKGIKQILEYARIEAYDWDGTDNWVCTACDWIWGGRNLLSNPFFSGTSNTPRSWELEIEATGGTYTFSDGTDTTNPIAFDAQAAAIETALQDDLGLVDDVIVTGTSVAPYRRTITLVEPPVFVTLTLNTGSLTGGSGTLTVAESGSLGYGPWTNARASTISAGTHNYDAFAISSAQAHSGGRSLLVDPGEIGLVSNRNPGIQQVVQVTPGLSYQGSIWIYPTSATDRFRLGIFTTGGEWVAWTNSSGVSLTINTWNQLILPDIVIPEGVTEVVFRTAVTNSGIYDPSAAWYDDAELIEGLAATTVGEIVRVLYEHATDTALRSPIVWEDETNPGTPYLTLDFTDAVDSAGNAWSDPEVRLYVYMRMSLYDVLTQLADSHGIEFRVVPDDVDAGTWLLQVYDKGSMSTVRDVAIQGGASDVRRMLRRFLPDTDYMVEGRGRVTARAANTALRSALGRMESARLDRELPSEIAVRGAVAEDASTTETAVEPWSYELVDPQDQPGTAYVLGDEITVHDPPEADGQARFWEYVATFAPESENWDIDLLPETSP